MSGSSRRDFLKSSAVGAAATAFSVGLPAQAAAAQSRAGAQTMPNFQPAPGQKYDLLIKGGEVIDPSQGLRGLRDVAIHNGRIAAVDADIAPERASQMLSASGHLVVPGLVDMHAHVYPLASGLGLPADELVPQSATTTYVSAGDAGANNFGGFRHWVISQARSRIVAFVHIANMGLAGFPVGEMLNIDFAIVEQAAKTIVENADLVLGIKVRESVNVVGENGLEPLRRAIAAAEMAGGGARVMCHIGGAPGDLSDLLNMLRPGDILTHAYSGAGNNTVQNGTVLPAALEAKARGVVIDVGHGGGSFAYPVAEPALDQGFTPDTIGSDVHAVSINTPGMPYLPWVMSKFLNLGFTLEQVIAMATINPARIIGRIEGLGTLRVGAPGDVSILDLVEEPVTFVDTLNNQRTGDRYLRPFDTVRAGRPFSRPYPQPFTYPS
ncbi:MAG: amidohydrolase/deacetylase family metallohydrolase [Chloroflexota bacterium]|nr:amidohydrolase/deacetylase family metallohydrolase [Chloroflexota bacterium]